jgi:hypothetical protein
MKGHIFLTFMEIIMRIPLENYNILKGWLNWLEKRKMKRLARIRLQLSIIPLLLEDLCEQNFLRGNHALACGDQ